ncbi:MAG: 16S rRNA (adenine(1518)-N(6)/adenine(1519)-N(6))-dimethyltransferase RsmA [Synergistaceae bacterium]|nr:16S rRNA (adenine(1518)-N(6)/adenine(1519)-N(6))-dimethyltransferase RsmA [Synergistaceae bacterium]
MPRTMRFFNNTEIGQNFLIDRSVVDFILKRAALTTDDNVLEIGPGEGILTRGLLSGECASVTTIELDTRLKDGIGAIAARDGRLKPLWGDAVQFDYESGLPCFPNRVIANLPYHITTPLLWVFLEKLVQHGLEYMLLMVQLESAQRITSPEGHRERSPLGITIEAMGTSAILRKVPPSAFRPQPKVNSCLIEIKAERRKDLPLNRTWRALLTRSFAQRRKTLVNNWSAGYADVTRESALAILERHGMKPTARAEELRLDEWFALAEEEVFSIKPKINKKDEIQ